MRTVYFAHDFMNAIKMFAFQFFLGNDRVALIFLLATCTHGNVRRAHSYEFYNLWHVCHLENVIDFGMVVSRWLWVCCIA